MTSEFILFSTKVGVVRHTSWSLKITEDCDLKVTMKKRISKIQEYLHFFGVNIPTKFGLNWLSSFGENKYVKCLLQMWS
jgi:hypothetical protein